MARQPEVAEKKYPPEVDYSTVLKGMIRASVLGAAFHTLMAILLITGLTIDLLGPWLGGWLFSIRTIAHGYIGAFFVLVFVAYIGSVVGSKKMRMVLTATNYVDFLFYVVLIITGVVISSVNKPWVDLFPGLSNALSSMTWIAPAIHVATTYIWILFSTVVPGGILHGLASVYLISHLKKKRRVIESQEA